MCRRGLSLSTVQIPAASSTHTKNVFAVLCKAVFCIPVAKDLCCLDPHIWYLVFNIVLFSLIWGHFCEVYIREAGSSTFSLRRHRELWEEAPLSLGWEVAHAPPWRSPAGFLPAV